MWTFVIHGEILQNTKWSAENPYFSWNFNNYQASLQTPFQIIQKRSWCLHSIIRLLIHTVTLLLLWTRQTRWDLESRPHHCGVMANEEKEAKDHHRRSNNRRKILWHHYHIQWGSSNFYHRLHSYRFTDNRWTQSCRSTPGSRRNPWLWVMDCPAKSTLHCPSKLSPRVVHI